MVKLAHSETRRAVALLAEGVDRNTMLLPCSNGRERSPSSRRAWIEIMRINVMRILWHVALLAEGVDRNTLAL